MEFLPIFLNIRGQPCLVVGGGDVAARKVELLLKAQASITVVAPKLCAALTTLSKAGKLTHVAALFLDEHVGGQRVVIAATDDEAVNRVVAETAQRKNIPVNVVDRPELCTFIMPAIIDRSPVVVAVSSGGASPVLARLLRAGGRFVFSICHPCFNNTSMALTAEQVDRSGEIITTYAVKVWGYLTPTVQMGAAIIGQPQPQPYFDRPLQVVLGACFQAGFVLDGLEETAFPPDYSANRNPLSWSGKFSDIPPVLVARVRLPR